MLLEIKDLVVKYEGAKILRSISFSVKEGEIVTLVGSNGAGKTTVLRTISGLKAPLSGEIRFQGRRIEGLRPQEIVRIGVVHVPQGRQLFPYMSVSENLRLGAFLRKGRDKINKDLDVLLTHFPILRKRSRQQACTLSGGEQQMLAIACGLMAEPKILLLDEPSLGLSPLMVSEIGKIVLEINQNGTSVLLVEQNARLALSLAHRSYVLETGSIMLEGYADELAHSEYVRKAYLGLE
jgi:branched-chain amino acid transport system ATP-binding protein